MGNLEQVNKLSNLKSKFSMLNAEYSKYPNACSYVVYKPVIYWLLWPSLQSTGNLTSAELLSAQVDSSWQIKICFAL